MIQQPLFNPQTEWLPPEEFPDLSKYDEIAIDLETKDPNLNTRMGSGSIVKNGDVIKKDSINNKIELKINNLEFDKRIKNLKLPTNKYHKGVVKKYINTVSSASKGCVTD